MNPTAAVALLLLTVLPAWQGLPHPTVQAGQALENPSFTLVRPAPGVRLRLCPDSVVLYIAEPGTGPKKLVHAGQSLAGILHRPVTCFASREKQGPALRNRDKERVTGWIQAQVRDGKKVDVVSHGTAARLSVEALRSTRSKKGQIHFYSLGQPVIDLSPRIPTLMVLGKEVRAGVAIDTKPATSRAESLGTFLARIDRDIYADSLNDLLHPKEKFRHPRQIHPLAIRLVADSTYHGSKWHVLREGFDLEEEKHRLDRWLDQPKNSALVEKNPQAIWRFNRLTADKGGPKNWYLDWYPVHRVETEAWKKNPDEARRAGKKRWQYTEIRSVSHRHFVPLNMHGPVFSEKDMLASQLKVVRDSFGRPSLSYEMVASRKRAYAVFTEANLRRHSAIILSGSVHLAPQIMGRIPGHGLISGRFKVSELDKLIQKCIESGMAGQDEGK